MIISAYALGNLGGMGIAGGTKRPGPKTLGWIATAIFPLFAVIYAALAWSPRPGWRSPSWCWAVSPTATWPSS